MANEKLTSELVRQFCGSSRFLRRFRGANSVCGESCGGGGIADGSSNLLDVDDDKNIDSRSNSAVRMSSCCVSVANNDCDSVVSAVIWLVIRMLF